MILDRVTISVLSAPVVDPVEMSFSRLTARSMVVLEVEADGLVGLGESWVNHPSWAGIERMATLEHGVLPLLAGMDVSDPAAVQRHLWARLGRVASQWGAPGPVWQALSAVDLALWDLAGRAAGVPVSQLWGRASPPHRVTAYASGVGPSAVEHYCALALAAGCTAVKARVGFGRDRDEETLARVRAAVGPDVALHVDANQAWSPAQAEDFCAWSSDYGVDWVEEPIASHDLDGLRRLASACDVTVACGENVYGLAELQRYATSGAVRVIQPDLAKSGGFSTVTTLAAGLPDGVELAPHCYGGALVLAASLHLAAAYEVVPSVELDIQPNPLRECLLVEPLVPREGTIAVPTAPGLGVVLDRDVLDRHTVDRRACARL